MSKIIEKFRYQKNDDIYDKTKSKLLSNKRMKYDNKVFGIRLSKTGTTSLAHALEVLGYETAHWKKMGKMVSWPEFFYLDAATDICCSSRFEALYHTFENSKFIYTKRSLKSWLKSIKKHTGMENPKEFRKKSKAKKFWESHKKWGSYNSIQRMHQWESLYTSHNSWKEAYEKYDVRVKSFFSDKNDGEFLEMNIIGGDGWHKLCDFLEKKIPEQKFPHKNKSQI